MLPVVLAQGEVDTMMGKTLQRTGYSATVDLEAQTVTDDDGWSVSFEIEPFRKESLLKGLDEIGRTLKKEDLIAAFEAKHPARW